MTFLRTQKAELVSETDDEMGANAEARAAASEKPREAQFPVRYLQSRRSLIFLDDFAVVPEIARALDVSKAQNAAFAAKAVERFDEIRELELRSRIPMQDDHGTYHRIPLNEDGKQRIRAALQADAQSILGDEASRALGSLLPHDSWFGQDEVIDFFSWYVDPGTGEAGFAIRQVTEAAGINLTGVSTPTLVRESSYDYEYRRFKHLTDSMK